MEFVASGDVQAAHCHMLSTGGMLDYARRSDAKEFIVATETGMLYPLQEQNPGKRFIPVKRAAVCRYMKMIRLGNLRESLLHRRHEVRVAPEVTQPGRASRSSAWSRLRERPWGSPAPYLTGQPPS
jgi:quinolinate synthase